MSMSNINPAQLLREYNLKPKKGLGQSFLIDDGALREIVLAADITQRDSVLEIGPGLGHLTRYLAEAAKKVVAVELDPDFIPVLQRVLADKSNVKIIQGDILQLDPARLIEEEGYLVVANIPYYITSSLSRHLLEARSKPARLVLTIQCEVAQRICARPGKMSRLALSVQIYGNPRQVLKIPASSFYPKPKVDSATVRVDIYPQSLIPADRVGAFFELVHAGFSQKRKMLHNTLSAGLYLSRADVDRLLSQASIDPQRRAQTLSIEEWKKLTEIYQEHYKHRNS